MPLPNIKMVTQTADKQVYKPRQMVAQYELEVDTFAIERAKGKYVLLSREESRTCLANVNTAFCHFNSPVYSVGPEPRACVIALYLNNEVKARQVCKIKVKPNFILPLAENISRGLWLISTLHSFVFTVTCRPRTAQRRGKTYTKKITPPIQSVTLPPNCAAHSEFITLPPYYDLKSDILNPPDLDGSFVDNNYSLWNPLYNKLPSFNMTWDLTPLDDMEELDMTELIETLDSIKPHRVALKYDEWGWGDWLLLGAGVIIILLVVVWFFKTRTNPFSLLAPIFLKNLSWKRPVSNETDSIPIPQPIIPRATAPLEETNQKLLPKAPLTSSNFNI